MPSRRPETVTVLFTDLVGSTAWRRSVGEPVADARTAELEQASRDVVTAAGGQVVKSTGDGVMATFSSASAALDAAARLQHVARRVAIGGTGTDLRVGVSTGDLVRQGDDWSGSAAIEAARLCAEADGGTVLVADLTARLGRGRTAHALRSLGPRTLRGFGEPIEVFELVPAPTRASALPMSLARAATESLVGRADKRMRIDSRLKRVAAGGTATMLVVGEPGVGKTRLAAAAAHHAAESGLTVLHGGCDEGSAAPYQPFIEALGPLFETLPDVVLRRVAGANGGLLATLWPELATRLPAARRAGDPESERWRLFEAITSVIGSSDEPLLLVLDDLQWAEPSTRALLVHLVRRAVPSLAILGTARRGRDDSAALLDDVGTHVVVETLELGGLPADEVIELIELHVGDRPPEQLATHLWRQTNGNPFFLGALLAHVAIRDDGGRWVTPEALDDLGVPDDVRAVVRRRLAVLGERARRALDVAAVCGLAFDEPTVRGMLGFGIDANVEALDEAIAVGVVREQGAGRYAFIHALVRDTLLEDLSRTRLARLHWRAGEELDRRSDRTTRLDEIAAHYVAADELGDDAIVLRASLEAGDDAMARLAFDEAMGHFQTSLRVMDRLPPDLERRYDLLTKLAGVLNALAEDAHACWLEAAAVAERLEDPHRIFAAIAGYDHVVPMGEERETLRLLDVVLELVGPDDSPIAAKATAWRALHRFRATADVHARDDLDRAVAMARRIGDDEALFSTLRARVTVLGDSPEVQATLLDATELSELPVTYAPWAVAPRDLARVLLRLGRRDEAAAFLAAAVLEAESIGSRRYAANTARMHEAAIAIAAGDFAEGRRLAVAGGKEPARHSPIWALAYGAQVAAYRYELGRVDEVIAGLSILDGGPAYLDAWRAMLAVACFDGGDVDRAADLFDTIVARIPRGFETLYGGPVAVRWIAELCRRLGDRRRAADLLALVEPWSGLLLVVNTSIEGAADRSYGHVLTTVGRLDEAIDAYAAGGELERRAGFPPLHARTGYWHARTLLERGRPGDRERAAELLDETIEITDRLGMRLLRQQAASVLGAEEPL